MSIMAKVSLLKQAETALSESLTAAGLSRVMSVLSGVLDGYEVEQTNIEDPGEDDLLQAYLAALKIGGRSGKTIDRYAYVLGRLLAYAHAGTRQITVYHLRAYLSAEQQRGIANTTLEANRQVYSAYFNWLHREGLLAVNPAANLGAVKCGKVVRGIYSDVDIERMRSRCRTARDRAVIDFLSSTGCRISEMTQLDRDSVNLANCECRVLGKGNKERTVYISQVAAMTIRQYLMGRKDDSPALFVGKGTRRLTPHGVRSMLHRIAAELGMDDVHPHKFRRTLATNLIRRGMPIQDVATILGHDKLDTTMKYVALDRDEIKHAYTKYA